MNFITYSKRPEYILNLIKNESLESPRHLSNNFECPERIFRRMINHFREKGCDIVYFQKNQKYLLKNCRWTNIVRINYFICMIQISILKLLNLKFYDRTRKRTNENLQN